MLKLGEQNIKGLYLGEQKIEKAYLGNNLVFDSAPPLPTYTNLKYITSKETKSLCKLCNIEPYFNTFRIVMDITPKTGYPGTNRYFFMGKDTYGFVYVCSGNSTNKYVVRYQTSSTNITYTMIKDKRIVLDYDVPNKKVKFGSSSFSFTTGSTSTRKITEINLGYVDTTGRNIEMDVYSVKVYSAGELIGDFVPCMKSSVEIGLYNKITDEFSVATGYTAGPAV